MKIESSVAFVTGANRGLGRAFALALVARGARVYAAARDPQAIAIPGVTPVRLDVTSAADIAEAVRRAPDVSLLINNAGISRPAGGGAVVNVLSVLSWLSLPAIPTYSLSKAAAWSLTNSLRTELAPQGTQVTAVHVGYMDTDMARAVTQPKIAPADVARIVLDAVAAGAREVLADALSQAVKQSLSAPDAPYLGAVREATP
jgi:NAD(P)-dependent dehydrogenase (short-subunit alcohol dehydrogenase family)